MEKQEDNNQLTTQEEKVEPTSNSKQIALKIPNIDEFVTSTFIDTMLDKLRAGPFLSFFQKGESYTTKFGLLGLYFSAILGLIVAVKFSIVEGPFPWYMSIGLGLLFMFFCVISHYLAVKFLPSINVIIKSTPTKMSSSAFLDTFALLYIISAVISIIAGISFVFIAESFSPFILGFIGLVFYSYLASICLNPSTVSIAIEKNANAAQELLGLFSFFIKTFLKMIPIAFSAAVLYGIFGLIKMLFTGYGYGYALQADFSSVMFSFLATLLPIFGYLLFLTYYFFIDLLMAVLSLNKADKA